MWKYIIKDFSGIRGAPNLLRFLSTPPGDPLTMILGRPLVERIHYTRVSRTHMRTKLKVLHVTYVVVVCNKSCQTVLQVKRLLSVLFYAFLSLSTASKRVVSES